MNCCNRTIGRCICMPQTIFLIFVIEMETTKTLFVLLWNSTQKAISKYGRTPYAVHRPLIKKYAVGKGEWVGDSPPLLPLINCWKKPEAANFPCIYASWELCPFLRIIIYVKLVCVLSQYTAESTYNFLFPCRFLGLKWT